MSETKEGRCEGCGEVVLAAGGSHGRADHAPDCDGSCRNCPVEVECGPVVPAGRAAERALLAMLEEFVEQHWVDEEGYDWSCLSCGYGDNHGPECPCGDALEALGASRQTTPPELRRFLEQRWETA